MATATVTVSSKFQVAIPKAVREGLALEPGNKVEIVQLEDRIGLVSLRPVSSLEGFLKNTRNTFKREGPLDERLAVIAAEIRHPGRTG